MDLDAAIVDEHIDRFGNPGEAGPQDLPEGCTAVESALTRNAELPRGTFRSVSALIAAIDDYLRHYTVAPQRFVWTSPPTSFSTKSRDVRQTSNG